MAGYIPLKIHDDITKCPICTEVYNDPRILPCIHTFCLKCIEKLGHSKKPQQQLDCPMCGEEVKIQASDLPKNFFIERLVEVNKLSRALTQKETSCELCSLEGKCDGETKTATVFCVECQQNMCQACCSSHKKATVSKLHRYLELGAQTNTEELLKKFKEDRCDRHPQDTLRVYCFDCKTVLCMMCYITGHNSHRCAEVSQVAGELSQQIARDAEGMNDKLSECQGSLGKCKQDEETFAEEVALAEKQITKRAEELKELIDSYRAELLEQLAAAAKKKQEKQIQSQSYEMERRILMIESFKKYSDEVRNKGTPCDIVRSASGLHDRAKELKEFSVPKTSNNVGALKFVSSSDKSLSDMLPDIFGKLKREEVKSTEIIKEGDVTQVAETPTKSPKLLHVIPSNKSPVSGVTSLGDELFVVRYGNKQIDVYDMTSLALQRHLTLPSTGAHLGIAACDTNDCIYVTEIHSNSVYRVDMTVADSPTVTSWSVGSRPFGVTVTANEHNVLVACREANQLEEYTTNGTRLREIPLLSGITNPYYVVQLSSGQFGITHGGSQHRYCVVGLDGKVVKSYGGSQGGGDGQLNEPCGLAVGKRRAVFIADHKNSRLLKLNPKTLTTSLLTIDGGFNGPYCLHVDPSCSRLYVGEWEGQRLLVLRA